MKSSAHTAIPRNTLEIFQETEPERDTKIIELLSKRHPDKPITVCFYGGEPFLAKYTDVIP